MRILLIEDALSLARPLEEALEEAGHAVDRAATLSEARCALPLAPWDAVLVDLNLPDGDGIVLIAESRKAAPGASVIVCSARDQITDRIRGLDAGADDYLVKPYAPEELLARLRAVERRKSGATGSAVNVGKLRIDLTTRTVTVSGEPVELTAREWSLLSVLASRLDRIHRKEALLEAIYDFDAEATPNALEVHIHNLRRKLGAAAIQTVRGLGYRLVGGDP